MSLSVDPSLTQRADRCLKCLYHLFHNAVQYLKGEGLLKTSNLVLELSHPGKVEYERSLAKPDAPPRHFPGQVIQQFNAPVGAVQTGAPAPANVVQNVGSTAGEVPELPARLRRDIETTLPPHDAFLSHVTC